MYGHFGLQRMTLPGSLTRHERPTSQAKPRESWAIGFGSAIGLVITTMLMGAVVLTATPHTVTVPLVTVLGFGMIASVLVAAAGRWRAIRRRSQPSQR